MIMYVSSLQGAPIVKERLEAEFRLRPDISACRFESLSFQNGFRLIRAELRGVQYDNGRKIDADASALKFYFAEDEGGRKSYALIDTRELVQEWTQLPRAARKMIASQSRPMLRKKDDVESIIVLLVLENTSVHPSVCFPTLAISLPETCP